MSVVPMQHIDICGLKKERKVVLEALQRQGVVEVCDMPQEEQIFQKTDMSEILAKLDKNVATAGEALEILNTYVPEKKSLLAALDGRQACTKEDYDAFRGQYAEAEKVAKRLVNLSKSILESKAEIAKLNIQSEALEPWVSLDIPSDLEGTAKTSVFLGVLPGIWTMERIMETFSEAAPLDVEILSTVRDQTFVFLICLKKSAEVLNERLRANGFSKPALDGKMAPAEQKQEFARTIEGLEDEIKAAIDEIEHLAENRKNLTFFEDYELMRRDKYEVIGRLVQSEHAFVLSGYLPVQGSEELKKKLEDKFTVDVSFREPEANDDVPVLLKNNGFAAPLESVTEGFSLPGKGELDPTSVMSLFYYMLFGIMFSDAGYGLVLASATGILLLTKKNMEDSMKNFLKMFFFCGLATMFWGIVFSSYFGDAITVGASVFFGKDVVVPPLWFSPTEEPMRMLVFSMILGVIHLLTGLVLKFVQSVKNHDAFGGFCDGVLWIVLLVSCIVFLMSNSMFMEILGYDSTLPKLAGTIGGIGTLIGAIGIIAFGGRESKSPFKRVMKGAYALYGITSYLSDILSYSRLLALGLATGVIGTVVNKMGSMAGSGWVKGLIFIIVFIFGHTLNFLINVLGAYVHTNRLQYVEFFGKFYEGGGRKFEPFRAKTKFYKIKEK